MTQKQQLRNGLYAVVAVALLIGLLFTQVNKEELYQGLQTQLSHSGIHLDANDLSLSLMYSGSIRLDGAHMKGEAFELDADHLFIDLDLPALLTGKAIPQALYLQFADINIIQENQNVWAKLLETDGLKLKRIDVSQSEIHFEQQHLTLEKVDLDIRDIGKNKNPRMELRAHIGDGRIDAHGYLHFKHGKLSKGFGRVRLFDIPIENWLKDTSLKTVSGSITSHINQDTSWQSFGHLSIQGEQKDDFELRVKLVGSSDTFLAIDEMVLNHKSIGALQFSGKCSEKESCDFTIDSKKIVTQPLLQAFNIKGTTNLELESIQTKISLSDNKWFTNAEASWLAFDYMQSDEKTENSVHMPAAKLEVINFIWNDSNAWNIGGISLFHPKESSPDIELAAISYDQRKLELPIELHHSSLWLPLSQWLFLGQYEIKGEGWVDGNIRLGLKHKMLTEMDVKLDFSKAEIQTNEFHKPLDIPLQFEGQLLWEEDKLPAFASLSINLAQSTFKLRHENSQWLFSDMEVNFDQFKEAHIQLPEPWSSWHGYIRGNTSLRIPEQDILVSQADVDLIQFGRDRHFVDGQIQSDGNQWNVKNLRWTQEKNLAEFFSGKNNQLDIIAESLNGEALVLLQTLPFRAHGKLQCKALRLPFGTISHVSSNYTTTEDELSLLDFKGSFYEGSLASKQVRIKNIANALQIDGTIQVGGIHLNNWLWLHKQFGTHLEATIYATLNLEGSFGEKQTLLNWKGDGDVTVYNGKWLFHDKNISADKVSLNLRRRKEFNTQFNIKDGRKRGKGKLRIDEEGKVSGALHWLGKDYTFSKAWPNFKFEEINKGKP